MTDCFFSIKAIKAANKAIGQHWFSASTMRFFNCRVLPRVYAGQYFITSEAYSYDSVRTYTIRKIELSGDNKHGIDTVGEVGQYATAQAAKKAVKELRCELE